MKNEGLTTFPNNKDGPVLPSTGERYVPELKGQIALEHLHRYAMSRELAKDKHVLDIACGEGYGSAMLANVARRVIGVDISKDVIDHANIKYKKHNLEFKVGSCSSIPIENASVDLIVSFETIEHHDQHEAMMSEIRRVLRPNGVLIISSPEKHEYSEVPALDNPFHVKELYRNEFERLMASHFKHVAIYGQRVIYGSGIFQEKKASDLVSFSFSQEHGSIKVNQGIARPVYLIAVASDGTVPKTASSVFEQPISESDAVQQWMEVARERDGQIAKLNQGIAERDRQIVSLNQDIVERNGQIISLSRLLADWNRQIAAILGSTSQQMIRSLWKKGSEFAPIDESGIAIDSEGVKVVAFYLPQFHPIPFNNAAWGRGFTEWTNVSKAIPQFVGHYQPHLPGELGFYDLRVPEIQKRQVELAKLYGIWGFCFFYYWFDGRRFLEQPIEQFVADKSLDLKFCLCWANENWTRRWDGLDQEVLIAQNHSAQDDIAFIKSIEHMLRDERYIRIGGRPVLIVSRPALLPDAATTAARWREYCRRADIGDLFLVAAQTHGTVDPRPFEFDAAVEFPPHNVPLPNIAAKVKLLNPAYKGKIFDYEDMVTRQCALLLNAEHEKWLTFRTVSPSWDNEARNPDAGHVFHGATPALYGRWLQSASAATVQNPNPEARLLFVNAWNEWAEGAHLEPDQKFGYAWLAVTKRVATQYSARAPQPRIAVILHLFYPDLWDEFYSHLLNIPVPFDLFITVPENFPQSVRSRIQASIPSAQIIVHENRGRDVLPFYTVFSSIPSGRYDYICKVHSKKTIHRPDGEEWRAQSLKALLGSPEKIRQILDQFDSHPGIGVVGPGGALLQSTYSWYRKRTKLLVRKLSERIGMVSQQKDFVFVAGTMFWFRPQAFSRLRALTLESADFEREDGQIDGTLAHAIERFLGLLALIEGYSIADTEGNIFTRSDCHWAGDGTDVIRSPWVVPWLNGRPF